MSCEKFDEALAMVNDVHALKDAMDTLIEFQGEIWHLPETVTRVLHAQPNEDLGSRELNLPTKVEFLQCLVDEIDDGLRSLLGEPPIPE